MLSVIDIGVWQVAAFLLRVDANETAEKGSQEEYAEQEENAAQEEKKREPYKPSPTDLPLKYFF